ncbi:polysaccharide synthase Cps1 [Hyaloscypha finlandica]|nr:polysaccharide synthase Cps1 [Hyaloscypha finlandica]
MAPMDMIQASPSVAVALAQQSTPLSSPSLPSSLIQTMPSNSQIAFIASIAFIMLWLYRYVRLIVNYASSWTFRSIPPPENPTYTSDYVTVIILTICGEDQHDNFKLCLRSCLVIKPYEILVIIIDRNLVRITELAHSIDARIQVIAISVANKREQICEAIPRITTPLTLIADDDIELPPKSLPHILAPFEDLEVSAVSTCQRIRRRPGLGILRRIVEYLGEGYIERRNFEISATSHMDSKISCLSSRLARGKPLNADDDNFVTRLLFAKGWAIRIQMCKEAEVLTTLECN